MKHVKYRWVWVNTIRQAWWEHAPGDAYRAIVVAATKHAAEQGVELLEDLFVQVDADGSLPDGLMKVVASAGACREYGAQTPVPRDAYPHRPKMTLTSDVLTTVDRLVRQVSSAHGLTTDVVLSRDRTPQVVAARQEVMCRLRDLGLSYPQIGRLLGRDHSTVQHAVRKRAAA